jgi:hypothetical protein
MGREPLVESTLKNKGRLLLYSLKDFFCETGSFAGSWAAVAVGITSFLVVIVWVMV